MTIVTNITRLAGFTPLLKVDFLSAESGAEIVAKLESFNPMSSVKDRIARAMIDDAEAEGKLGPGGLIIEATSGNTGIGLAWVAASRGYRLVLTMPETMSLERRRLLRALGAELVLTPGSAGMKGALAEAERIHRENPGSFMPAQFDNPANPEIHRRTTAREIWEASGGKIDILVAGVGTGGTVTGCALGLREYHPGIRVVAVEPAESAVLSGEMPGPHGIQGIGAGFVPAVLRRDLLDEVVAVSTDRAVARARQLAAAGIFSGISSGAAAEAAVMVGRRPENQGRMIVAIFPDSGERYLSTEVFSSD
ncbi:MAG: cysteine synthase A [Deltaproteobacteria bacterium]|nr:cysteine synthase A [Deltaproteobacteria bacterium]